MQTRLTDLILFPGWGFQASIFMMLTPYLANYHLHLIDLPIQHDSQTLTALANTLPDQAVLAGWSLGGLTAISLCAMFPEKFSKLILLGSTPKFVADNDWKGIPKARARQFSTAANVDINKTIGDFLMLSCLPSHSIKGHLITHSRNDAAALLAQLDFLFRADFRNDFASLIQPSLSLAGERDAILPVTSGCEIIPGAGHAFPFTHAAEVCRRMHHFISSNHDKA